MSKNLIVCCDGTGNKFGSTNTNVVKLYSVLEHDLEQIAYYHPGLGTMGSPAAWTRFARAFTRFMGLAFGFGLASHIESAYLFLMEHFEPGDRVFLFEFSRGAYTVRSLAAAPHMFGLMRQGNQGMAPYLTALFKAKDKDVFKVAAEFKATFSIECKPHFLGVWDTVSSVGWLYDPVRLPYTYNNPDIAIGRHAVSIDERRCFFRQNLMAPAKEGQDIRQLWFPGVHCDVGGGYAKLESGLANNGLHWMIDEADRAGLRFDPIKRQKLGQPDALGPIHMSLQGAWWILEYWPRRVTSLSTGTAETFWTRGRRRTILPGALIHPSVSQRQSATNGVYDPPNLPPPPSPTYTL